MVILIFHGYYNVKQLSSYNFSSMSEDDSPKYHIVSNALFKFNKRKNRKIYILKETDAIK